MKSQTDLNVREDDLRDFRGPHGSKGAAPLPTNPSCRRVDSNPPAPVDPFGGAHVLEAIGYLSEFQSEARRLSDINENSTWHRIAS
jgi:hypothetical protein